MVLQGELLRVDRVYRTASAIRARERLAAAISRRASATATQHPATQQHTTCLATATFGVSFPSTPPHTSFAATATQVKPIAKPQRVEVQVGPSARA